MTDTTPTKPPDPHRFVCMTTGCTHSRISSQLHNTTAEAESNARTAGWVVWAGTTRSGTYSTAVYCPIHAGKHAALDDDLDVETGFDADCDSCYLKASEDWGSDFDGTEECAEEWMEQHRCEPQVNLIRPTRKQAVA